MSSHGYIKLYRAMFKHEFFRPSKFSEREAFTWMISEAAWKPRSRRVGQFFVDLNRGEMVASLRHLGDVWGWEVGAVRGYLARCEREGMLNTRSDKGITTISICNYETYQGDDSADDKGISNVSAQGQQGASTAPAHGQHNTEEIKHSRREELQEGEEQLASQGRPAGRDVALVPPSASARKRAAPKTMIDVDQPMSDADRLYAREKGWPEAQINQQFEKFKNFHISKGNLMASWPAAWRTWVGNGYDIKGGRGGPPTPTRADSAIEGMFSDLTPEDFRGRTR